MTKFDTGIIWACIYMTFGFLIWIVFTIRIGKRHHVIVEYVPSKDDWLLR